ncbi:peptidyl-glycine alpha-amidating monooxygenase B isoform X2 [Procambarus clarkii]|uniref:peptidyl-glycine alpha-amidating monooxygenase B isoform X2 n=1 Tax=Procambarus clarkii TaxID=6728 RepID=UPI003743E63C
MPSTARTTVTRLGLVLAALLMLPRVLPHTLTRRGEPSQATYKRNFTMPGVSPKVHDSYLCTAVALDENVEEWVVKFDPLASANRAHHMLLFGCSDVDKNNMKNRYWDCGHHGVCMGGRIMYAWAKNAPATVLPEGVGFRIGGKTGIRYLTLQIHYGSPLPDGVADHSGLEMELTHQQQKYKAGIYLLAAGGVDIPPYTEKTHADLNCAIGNTGEPSDIYLFAYRVHAHVLGTVISGYLFDSEKKDYTEIAKGNPHWPQAFYPMTRIRQVKPSDILHARCTWNSTARNRHTYIGSTAEDEMCNLYLMYYTDRDKGSETGGCMFETFPVITHNLPPDSDVPLPPNPLLEEHAKGENRDKEKSFTYSSIHDPIILDKKAFSRKDPQPDNRYPQKPSTFSYYEDGSLPQSPQVSQGRQMNHDTQKPVLSEAPRKEKQLKTSVYHLIENWGQKEVKYGQVVAVAIDSHGDVLVFHRGERSWDGSTFVGDKLRDTKNAIAQATLLHLNKNNGQILHEWGEKYFFMPHGLTVDKDDNIWVTDVGLHQVLKFPAGYGQGQPILTLGTRFEPGNDDTHFCKPTGVAVMKNGEFFVSDGYCNSRVIKYSADGKILFQFGKASNNLGGFMIGTPAPGTFSIPHALALAEDQGEVCVADRENGRVQCFTVSQGKFRRVFQYDDWGGRLFSVAYTPAFGGKLFAVNGPQMLGISLKLSAFEVDYTSAKLKSSFSPNNQGFSNPHDIAVSDDGYDVYIVEIGPNKLWKFELDSAMKVHSKTVNASVSPSTVMKIDDLFKGTAKAVKIPVVFSSKWSSAGVSTVILGLLAVPIIVLTAFALIIRARRNGRFRMRNMHNGSLSASIRGCSGKHENGLGFRSLLNKNHGFEKVATEDLDHDAPDSGDSDIEEFSQVATKA